MTRKHITARIAVATMLVLQAACATAGSTWRSGVGDAWIEHPPYYAGQRMVDVSRAAGAIGHLPVAYQPGASHEAMFDPRDGSGSAVDVFLEEVNAYLDSLGVSRRLVEGRRVSAVAHADTRGAPDVRFGCAPEFGVPGNDCAERGDSALGRGLQQMHLSVGRPAATWVEWVGQVATDNGVDRVLVVTLEVGQYLLRQEGFAGTKILELGTGHRARLPWLTSLEQPVSVLQFTASLVDRSGKAVRIGAEGFYPRRTGILVSSIDGQELVSDDDVNAARVSRREDLPGNPLAWKVAFRELVGRVTGRATDNALASR